MKTAQSSPSQASPASAARVCLRGIGGMWDGLRRAEADCVVWEGERILWVGAAAAAPPADLQLDAGGRILMPALVDCHTHSVYAGSRLGDFLRRQGGESYSALLEGGGGIHLTVAATRAASDARLRELTAARLADMRSRGVGCVEIKGGYGLSPEDEARMLRIAREAAGPTEVVTTFLGAHALPPGRDRGDYVDEVVGAQLDRAAPWADAVDVYCDRGAFTLEEAERVLRAGRAAGLRLRIHAEQCSATGAAAMAARLGADSADHLEHLDAAGVAALAEAGTVAVLLPGALLYLRDPPPPVAALRAAGVPMAVATDLNPGSSPVRDLWTCATLACVHLGLSPEEALAGITAHAARALHRPALGRVTPGARADLLLVEPPPGEPPDPRVLVQYMGGHRAARLWLRGVEVLGPGSPSP